MFAILLLAAPAEAAPYVQWGADAGRTGLVGDPGPERFDLAFPLEGPGLDAYYGSPTIILDGMAYVLLQENTGTAGPDDRPGLWRIDLHRATMELFHPIDAPQGGIGSDGASIFFAADGALHGVPLDGSDAWRLVPTWPGRAGEDVRLRECLPPAVQPPDVTFACTLDVQVEARPGDESKTQILGVVRVDRDGQQQHARSLDPATDRPPSDGEDLLVAWRPPVEPVLQSMAWAGDQVYLGISHTRQADPGGEVGPDVWALDAEVFEPRWSYEAFWDRSGISEPDGELAWEAEWAYGTNVMVAATATEVLVASSLPASISPEDGIPIYQNFHPRTGENRNHRIGAPALVPGYHIFPTYDGMRAFDPEGSPIWNAGPAFDWDAPLGTLVLDDRVVRWSYEGEMLAWRLQDGHVEWRQRMGVGDFDRSFGAGEGVLVAAWDDRSPCDNEVPNVPVGEQSSNDCSRTIIHVFGQTDASIQLTSEIGTLEPDPGEPVRIGTSGTRPGALADDVEIVVRWGDATEDRGVAGSVFEHAYDDEGTYTVEVLANNSAGQEASEVYEVDVGGREPSPTFLESRFSAEHQESTFFILGLLVTLLFAAFGALRFRRKRRLLRRELTDADRIVERHRDEPDLLRDALREHRHRARRLFLSGRLDEGSAGILERHIDERLRDHRLSRVEADLAFLPHGLFRAMQEMLRDARVTELERTQFLSALEADKRLNASEKRKVRHHVEAWRQQDAS